MSPTLAHLTSKSYPNFIQTLVHFESVFVTVESILNLYELKTEWPPEIEVLFNMYRVAVFFWILIGLVWLSGVISLVTEAIKTKGKSFGSEFSKPQKYTNKINNAKVVGLTETFF